MDYDSIIYTLAKKEKKIILKNIWFYNPWKQKTGAWGFQDLIKSWHAKAHETPKLTWEKLALQHKTKILSTTQRNLYQQKEW